MGGLKDLSHLGVRDESQETRRKRERKRFVVWKQRQVPGGICQYLTQFLQNKLSLRPQGKQPGSGFFDLGGGSLPNGLYFPAGIQRKDAASPTALANLERAEKEQDRRQHGRRNALLLTG